MRAPASASASASAPAPASLETSGASSAVASLSFCSLLDPNLSYLDGKHVVFGKVTKGMDIVSKVEALGNPNKDDIPSKPCVISACGAVGVHHWHA